MAVVLKWKRDGQYLSRLVCRHGGFEAEWKSDRSKAMRCESVADLRRRVSEHFGEWPEWWDGQVSFVRLVPKRREEEPALSAEDAETLRGAGYVEESDAWRFPPTGRTLFKSPGGLESLRCIAERIRERKASPDGRAPNPTDIPAMHTATHGGVTLTAPATMSLGDVYRTLREFPALRVALDAEVKRAVDVVRVAGQRRTGFDARDAWASGARGSEAVGVNQRKANEIMRKAREQREANSVQAQTSLADTRDAAVSVAVDECQRAIDDAQKGPGEAPSGMRIERRDVEYLVGAVNGGTDAPGNGCGESGGPAPGYNCTCHFGGEHLATFPSDGAEEICARWPIAPTTEAT